jgi:hypothetical protein
MLKINNFSIDKEALSDFKSLLLRLVILANHNQELSKKDFNDLDNLVTLLHECEYAIENQ